MPNPKQYKGKAGKQPGSTLLIKSIDFPQMPYKIVDLPGFGYMKSLSHRREEHIKNQIVIHVEKHHDEYFFGLVVINVLRVEDELKKYFLQNKKKIPLSFELIQFLNEFNIPLLILFNKIDKVSTFDKNKIIFLFIESAKEFGLNLIHLNDFQLESKSKLPYLEFSALKKINLIQLKGIIRKYLEKI